MDETTSFEGWMILELFGHNMIAGFVSEEARGGVTFFRVDVPSVDGQDGFTKYFHGNAVYAMTPSDEATVRLAASRLGVRPITPWVVPDARRELPAPTVDEWDAEDLAVDDDLARATRWD